MNKDKNDNSLELSKNSSSNNNSNKLTPKKKRRKGMSMREKSIEIDYETYPQDVKIVNPFAILETLPCGWN